jgi:hypothetical protein
VHRIEIGGIDFIPDLSGALFAPDFRTLLVADLHLEQGSSLARCGIHVPPFDTSATLAALEEVVATMKPMRLMLLGDSFHDAAAHSFLDNPHVVRLRRITDTIETVWITGNHDPAAPDELGGMSATEHRLGDITLRHIPSRRLCEPFEIAGHLHPGAMIVQRGIATRTKCFVGDRRRMILPAFGAYTGAVNVRTRAFVGLFDEDSTSVWMIASSRLHRFPLNRCS